MAQRKLIRSQQQWHPDCANSFDRNRERREREEEDAWLREAEHRHGRTGMTHLVPKELLAKRWLCQVAPCLINGSCPEVNAHQPGH